MKFNICSITNSDNFVFDELITSYASAIHGMGHEALVSRNMIVPFTTNILIGAHQDVNLPELPKNTILCNTEQLIETSWWLTERYVGLLKKYTVWDYSKFNVEKLKKDYQITNAYYAGLGYSKALETIKQKDKDIDILFYGSISERRAKILQQLCDEGLGVETLYGVYGKERDDYIARSKIVINIHFFKECYFEPIRVGYLINNGAFVISEKSVNKEDENIMADSIVVCPYDSLVERCKYYLQNEEERVSIARKGQELYRLNTQEKILRPLINKLTQVKVATF